MKKLISISASFLLAGASLVGVSAPAQAAVSVNSVTATLNSAGNAVIFKCLGGGNFGGSINVIDVWINDPVAISTGYEVTVGNLTPVLVGDTITLGVNPLAFGPTDGLLVVVKSQSLTCAGSTFDVWKASYEVSRPKTLTYNANSGAGMISATTGSGALTVSSGTNYTRSGYTLAGWNTLANGNGTPVALGASYTPSQNETLYAQWTAIPVTTPVVVQAPVYTGPEFNAIAGRVVDSVEGGKVVLAGRRLDSVTKISLAGKVLTPTKSTESSIELTVPAGTPGSATLEITFTSGRMTWTNAFDYVDPAVVKAQAANKLPKPAAKPATKPAAKVTKAKPKAKK
jgi:uncharacterized repeat protein (TIGR02543 family)